MPFDSPVEMGYMFRQLLMRTETMQETDISTDSCSRRRFRFFTALLAGIAAAQITATAVVWFSDINLLGTTESVTRAGYLSIPGNNVDPPLDSFEAAFCGGLFFTFSIGICLSFLGLSCAWLWGRMSNRDPKALFLFALLPAACVWKTNGNGFCFGPTAFFIFVPVAAFVTGAFFPASKREKRKFGILVHIWSFLTPLILLAVFTSVSKTKIDSDVFTRIRDDILISNTAGLAINDFYYRYTLYPARIFKNLNQRTIRTCRLSGNFEKGLAKRLERTLMNRSWLVMPGNSPVDLDINVGADTLVFSHDGKTVFNSTAGEFLKKTVSILKDFSAKTDRHVFFRQFTFVSILFSCSVTLYLILFHVFRLTVSLFSKKHGRAVMIACTLTVLAETAFLVSLVYENKSPAEAKTAMAALQSGDRDERIRALKTLFRMNIHSGNFPMRGEMLVSPFMPDRYWIAKIHRFGKGPEVYRDVVSLLDDAHPSVVYNALEALGELGKRKGADEILKRMRTFDHWYIQLYAHKTLRRLGWRQSRSE